MRKSDHSRTIWTIDLIARGRLPVGDTAGCQPALQGREAAQRGSEIEIVGCEHCCGWCPHARTQPRSGFIPDAASNQAERVLSAPTGGTL